MPRSSSSIWRRWIRRISGGSIRKRSAARAEIPETGERSVRFPLLSAFSVLSVLSVLSTPNLSAQTLAAGHVVLVSGRDTTAIPNAMVVLHRVGRQVQGPIDSVRTDARGRFRFHFTPDTTAIFLVSAEHAGVQYFSPPVHVNPALPDTALTLIVADTSRNAPVSIEARHIVFSRPAKDGTRPVLEIVVLANHGDRTRVAPDSLTPSWAMRLPRGVLSVQPGQGDFSPEAIGTRGDSLLVFAPISPGDKQIVVGYTIPANLKTVGYSIDQPAGTLDLLLEESGGSVSGGLAAADSQTIEGRTFHRWTGSPAPGSVITVNFPGIGSTRWLLPALVGMVALAFGVAAALLIRQRSPVRAPAAAGPGIVAGDSSSLLDRIAGLDAQFLGREHDVPADEWADYQRERASLKAELARSLARSSRGT
jgi:hypothetical protein